MTDSETLRFVDGQPMPVGTLTRAELVGQGLFETMRWTGSRLPLLAQHEERLARGARMIGYDPDEVLARFRHELDAHVLPGLADRTRDCVLRFQISHTQQKRGYGTESGPLATLWQMHPTAPDVVMGVSGLSVSDQTIPAHSGAPLKHSSRLDQVLAAQSPDAASAVRCDDQGFVREGLSSNIFWVRAGHVYTPDLTRHGVAGTLAEWLLAHYRTRGMPVLTGDFPASALYRAEALWLTNALGVQVVNQLGNTRYNTQNPVLLSTLDAVRQLFQ